MSTRRELLQVLAAAAAQHQHQEPAPPATPYTAKVFTPEQLARVAEIVDLIIPRTDTPGASDAHVHEMIDRKLAGNPTLKQEFLAGLAKFDASRIAQLSAAKDPFFTLIKDMTIDGYYTSREGLAHELGWHGNTFLTEFKGCTHPEHQS